MRLALLATVGALLMMGCGAASDPTVAPSQAPPSSGTTAAAAPAPTSTVADPPPAAATTAPSVPTTLPSEPQICADVIGGEVVASGSDTYTVSATVRSGDTGWDKYADAWTVATPDGIVLGERVLAHPHETEQPFTRSLGGVEIPAGVATVVLAARDSVEGFCGATFEVAVP